MLIKTEISHATICGLFVSMMARSMCVVVFSSLLMSAVAGQVQSTTNINNGLVVIYGGDTISIEQAPFMAEIYTSRFLIWFYKFTCGGAIIHEKFVLTAAHCTVDYYSVKVGVGSDRMGQGEMKYVDKRISRNDYDGEGFHNDITLLRLVEPLKFGPRVAPLGLPNKHDFQLEKGTLVQVTGWGNTETSSGEVSELRQASVPIVISSTCLSEKEICAGTNGIGTCNGDSGGPLTYNNTLIGLVSNRPQPNCAGPSGTIYMKVASYSEWIKAYFPKN